MQSTTGARPTLGSWWGQALLALSGVLVMLLFWAVAGARGAPAGTPKGAHESAPGFEAPAGVATPTVHLLSETGLYLAGSVERVDPKNLPYVPQYPLWSDGASKRRWIRLPAGTAIDARDPDNLEFPIGTTIWKEFSFGRRVETRLMQRLPDRSWRFASYVWRSAHARDAELAPEQGALRVAGIGPGVFHDVPSHSDCRACHEGRDNPVLGFSMLQLSPARDPLAPHREVRPHDAVGLPELVERGLLVNVPQALLERPPVIQASSATERAARGYLFANCASCHNAQGPLASLGLSFDVSVARPEHDALRRTALGQPSRFTPPGVAQPLRIAPGRPDASTLAYRIGSRDVVSQMPPMGTRLVDDQAVALIARFIAEDLTGP